MPETARIRPANFPSLQTIPPRRPSPLTPKLDHQRVRAQARMHPATISESYQVGPTGHGVAARHAPLLPPRVQVPLPIWPFLATPTRSLILVGVPCLGQCVRTRAPAQICLGTSNGHP
ncbi:hypothetical protein FRC12_013239 [Ceratobasidium sp. 428]|nr:hypothetical protein FRC12_013239 [Ceratobasidium sp. 428]